MLLRTTPKEIIYSLTQVTRVNTDSVTMSLQRRVLRSTLEIDMVVAKFIKVLQSFRWLSYSYNRHNSMVSHTDLLWVRMHSSVVLNTINITVTKRDRCILGVSGRYKTWTQKVVFKETCKSAKMK